MYPLTLCSGLNANCRAISRFVIFNRYRISPKLEMAGDEYLAEVEGRAQRLKLNLGITHSTWMKKLGTKAINKGGYTKHILAPPDLSAKWVP